MPRTTLFQVAALLAGAAVLGSPLAAKPVAGAFEHGAIRRAQSGDSCSSPNPCLTETNQDGGAGIEGDSNSSYGLYGTSGQTWGVYGTGAGGVAGVSQSGKGLYGSSISDDGVYGASTNKYGVYGQSNTTWGVYGTGAGGVAGVSQSGKGLYGSSISDDAVYGVSSGAFGVYGQSNATWGIYGTGANGVLGKAPTGIGVLGNSHSSDGVEGTTVNGRGVWGYSTSGSGVSAQNASKTVPALFANNTAGGPTLQLGNATNNAVVLSVDSSGNLSVGASAFVNGYAVINGSQSVGTDEQVGGNATIEGDALVGGNATINGALTVNGGCYGCSVTHQGVRSYATRASEPILEDLGEAQTDRGFVHVPLERRYASAISQRPNYLVFITPDGDTRGLFVTNRSLDGFDVREAQGGRGSVSFSYRIVASPYGAARSRLPLVVRNRREP